MSTATDELKDKGSEMLVKMIDFTVQSMNDVLEFSKQQIPDVIHQLLMWKATNSLVWLTVGIIILLGAIFWGKKVNKWGKEQREEEIYIFGHLLTALLTFASFCFIIYNLLEVLQIWIAPKVYLIQMAADLVKK